MTLYAVRKKYGNTETAVDGMAFASKLEARRYAELLLLERAGEISGLKVQEWICLQPPFISSTGEKIRAISYVADFVYVERSTGQMVVEDTKGFQTAESKLKMKMLKYVHRGYDVRMVYAKPKAKAGRKPKAGFGKVKVT